MSERAPDVIRIDTNHSLLERDASGFVRIIAKKDVDHSLDEAVFTAEFIRAARVDSGRRVRLLVDMRAARSLSRAARLHYQSPEQANDTVGTALLVDSGISRVIGNFTIALNKGPMKIRLFTDEASARAWLDSLAND